MQSTSASQVQAVHAQLASVRARTPFIGVTRMRQRKGMALDHCTELWDLYRGVKHKGSVREPGP